MSPIRLQAEQLLHVLYLCFSRPTVAGIHSGPDGCYSVALSGGYEDDIDYGECFTYTGEGSVLLCSTYLKLDNIGVEYGGLLNLIAVNILANPETLEKRQKRQHSYTVSLFYS